MNKILYFKRIFMLWLSWKFNIAMEEKHFNLSKTLNKSDKIMKLIGDL